MAQKHPYDDSGKALYTPAKDARFFESWDQRDIDDHDLLCAEMSRLAYADKETVTRALGMRRVGFTLKLWTGGETPAERAKTLGTDGFIAIKAGLAVLAFRGTEANRPEDILADAFVTPQLWTPRNATSPAGRVSAGFAHVYGCVRDAIGQVLDQHVGDVLVTGHSLGAALATLAAADHAGRTPKPKLITFGSPRVGDGAFAGLLSGLTTIHRFVDCCDLVTRVPPKAFDPSHIEDLLTSLIPERLAGPIEKGVVKAVALGLSTLFKGMDPPAAYVDIGELRYRDRAGSALANDTEDAIDEDQRQARAAYPRRALPSPTELIQPLEKVVSARGDAKQLRAALREVGVALFRGDEVPLRDLADHAPINYVSLFTGRV
jgi:pimeloyl-ACP methyl ester carboxylesterase